MKARTPETATRLQQAPNIGPATEADLLRLGIDTPDRLIGQDAVDLYRRLCELDRQGHDPCVIDVFLAAIHFMETGESRPWHAFSDERRKRVVSG